MNSYMIYTFIQCFLVFSPLTSNSRWTSPKISCSKDSMMVPMTVTPMKAQPQIAMIFSTCKLTVLGFLFCYFLFFKICIYIYIYILGRVPQHQLTISIFHIFPNIFKDSITQKSWPMSFCFWNKAPGKAWSR